MDTIAGSHGVNGEDKKTFIWVMNNLWAPRGDKFALNIPDTVVLDQSGRGTKWWLFTGKNGVVLKKSEKTIRPNPIEKAIRQFASTTKISDEEGTDRTAAYLYFWSGKRKRVTFEELQVALPSSLLTAECALFQQSVAPRGGEDGLIACKYKLDQNGVTFSVKLQSKNEGKSPPHREVERTVGSIAKQLERNCGDLKILKMKVHFVLGQDGKHYLTNITSISTMSKVFSGNSQDQRSGMLSDSSTLTKSEYSLTMSESFVKKSRKKKCAGDFCGFNADDEKRWQLVEASLGVSGISEVGYLEGNDQDPMEKEIISSCATQIQVPEHKLQKISFRSISLAKEKESLDLMNPLLKGWAKRSRAAKSKLKAVSVSIKPLAKVGGTNCIPVLLQDSHAEIEWEWTGRIDFVNLTMVPVQADYGEALEIPQQRVLAHACRNTGSVNIQIPLVYKAWAAHPVYWRFVVSDLNDKLVEGMSEAFLLGGQNKTELPTPPKEIAVPPRGVQSRGAYTDSEREVSDMEEKSSFSQVHRIAHYHRTAKVCETCFSVYQMLDSARLEHSGFDMDNHDPLLSKELELELDRRYEDLKQSFLELSSNTYCEPWSKPSLGKRKNPSKTNSAKGLGKLIPVVRMEDDSGPSLQLGEEEQQTAFTATASVGDLFNRLAVPKRSLESSTSFVEQQRWGAGFSLRKAGGEKKTKSDGVVKSKNQQSSGEEEREPLSLPNISRTAMDGEGSKTSAPRKRKVKLQHHKNAENQVLGTYTDTDEEEDGKEDSSKVTSRKKKSNGQDKEQPSKDGTNSFEEKTVKNSKQVSSKKTGGKLSPLARKSKSTQSPNEEAGEEYKYGSTDPLEFSELKPGTNLYDVICVLALGQLEECKRAKRLVEKRGLASLAFSKVENGRLVVRKHATSSNASKLKTQPSFQEVLTRTKHGRQTLELLGRLLAVSHTFIYAVEKQAQGEAVSTRDSLLLSRAKDACTIMESFSQKHATAEPRLHLMSGVHAILSNRYDDAFDSWKQALGVGARLEGTWSYNVGIAHFLIGKHAAKIHPGDESFCESHLAAAAAIFSRLNEKNELTKVQHQQQQQASSSSEKVNFPDKTFKTVQDDRINASPLAGGQITERLIRDSKEELRSTIVELKLLGILPENSATASEAVREASKEVHRVVKAAEQDLEILEGSSREDKHHQHRKTRIKDALELVHIKVSKLKLIHDTETPLQRTGSGSRSGSSQYFTVTSSSRGGASESSMGDSLFVDQFLSTPSPRSGRYESFESSENELEGGLRGEEKLDRESLYSESDGEAEDALALFGYGEESNSTEVIFQAAHEKNLIRLKQKLKEWMNRCKRVASEAVDNQGNTLLHIAASENWIQGIHTCLSLGVDVNAKNIEGNTPLHLAREFQHSTAETLLIALGSDTSLTNIYGLNFEQGARYR